MEFSDSMIFRQLFDSVSGTYSYLLASRRGGEALIIDPVLEKVDRYLQLVNELDLKLVKAVDTHIHADHITGLGALRDRTHCITVMGEKAKVDVVSMRVTEGDKLTIEGLALDVLYTPGHTDDSYSFLHARPRLHRRHAADPRHRPHRFPERQRARAIRVAVRQAAEAAGGDAGLSRPRLQGRHGLHHRRGEALQSAPAGQIGRRVRRPDEQAQPAQSEDDGRGGARQHAHGPGPGRDCAQGLGGDRRAGACARRSAGRGAGRPARAAASARSTASIPGSLHAPYPDLQENIRAGGMLHELAAATGKRLVFYCAFGERSAMAVQAAQDAGLTSACHIHGGIDAWRLARGALQISLGRGALQQRGGLRTKSPPAPNRVVGRRRLHRHSKAGVA